MDTGNSYVSLANKYRPQTFEDMVGQESISKTLQNAIKSGRIAHAYLFYGPRGCGKTTTARILAKALNCTGREEGKPTASPCGECAQCREIAQSQDLDVLELDAASNTQVEKVRELIIDKVALAPARDRFKVFILDEVHMLSSSSFNALLKTIEEPPAHVIFILATTEKHKVPATIVSRCQTFRFRPLSNEEITDHLLELAEAENLNLTAAAAKLIAKNAGGAMRDALTLLDRAVAYCGERIDEEHVGEMLGLTPEELIRQSMQALFDKDGAALHRVFETLQTEGFDANSFLKDLKNALGESFYFRLGQGTEPFVGAKEVLANVSAGFLAQLSRKLNKLLEEVKFADNALVSAEVGLFTVMDSCLDIDRFIRRLEALEKGTVLDEKVPPSGGRPVGTVRAAAKPVTPARQVSVSPTPATQKTEEKDDAEPVIRQAISNGQLREKLLQFFEQKSPFLYDVLLNSRIQFDENKWTLSFAPEHHTYYVTALARLKELESAAKEMSGRVITFVCAKPTEPAPVTEEKPQPAPAKKRTAAKKTVSAQPAAKIAKEDIISEEEPFVKDDFSQEAATPAPAAAAPKKKTEKTVPAPDELKDVLNIFGGDVVV